MSLFFEYGRAAVTLPKLSPELLARAGRVELMLLLALASDAALFEGYEQRADALAASLSVSRAELDNALSFWLGAGVISREKAAAREPDFTAVVTAPKKPKPEPTVSVPRRTVTTELPHYTADELDRVMATRKNAKGLVDEAQKALGKIFTSHSEVAQLIGMAEGLSLSNEYILILLAHCRDKGKTSLRYAEKLAVSLYDQEITTPEALTEYLHARERAESEEGNIRRLFGIGNRTLTAKEKGFISDWVVKYGFGTDMLEKAYEFAADATANPTLAYVNSILKRWFEEKITTPADADRDRDSHRAAAEKAKPAKKGKKTPPTSDAASFNVDEFFEAAIQRGYSDITGKKGSDT